MSEKNCCGAGTDAFKELDAVLDQYAKVPGSLITILQKAQDIYGYLSVETINRISDATGIKPAKIYGVATFYAQFRLQPVGKYLIMLARELPATSTALTGSRKLSPNISVSATTRPQRMDCSL
jgi:NADH-quinone oxidoreductase subunit E